MKNIYPNSKGKIYPSPTSPSSPSTRDVLSVLKYLPATILLLISALSFEEREVLAYLISRSMKSPCSMIEEIKKSNKRYHSIHKPIFDCGCFDCYTSFWFRWDSSPNREVIHQAIEAFEDHLSSSEPSKKNYRSKKKEKRVHEKLIGDKVFEPVSMEKLSETPINVLEKVNVEKTVNEPQRLLQETDNVDIERYSSSEDTNAGRVPAANGLGLVRKVWPDVLGLFNSHLWNLWNPTV